MTLTLKVKRLTDTAKLPTYAHEGDACFDLYADSVTFEEVDSLSESDRGTGGFGSSGK